MATYFIGDVHGCRLELARLLDLLQLTAADQVYLTGDLFDRGPDPLGVLDLVRERSLHSILSNHEDYLYRTLVDYARTGELETRHEYIARCLRTVGARAPEFMDFIRELPLFRQGEGWLLVHAGIDPYQGLEATCRRDLLSMRTWPSQDRSAPKWYELYQRGPLVIFGHNARSGAVLHHHENRLMAVGLDTGCCYGGQLTAFRLEDQTLHQVQATRDYRRG
jgi:hypothetical protein